jgi:DNA-binding NarL/FixJ family response regulator
MEILFVDDDQTEANTFKEAIKQLADDIRVSHITYCTEVLWLLKWKKHDLVLLRVDGESKNGVYFLQSIRSLKELAALPVIMYSTVITDCYVDRCYKGKANFYYQKPDNITGSLEAFSRFLSTDMKSQKRIARAAFVV